MHPRPVILAAGLLAMLGAAQRLAAQADPRFATDSACSYQRCTLSIAPRWNGLALVRGTSATPVVTLGFFWPRPLDRVFAGDDAASVAVSVPLHFAADGYLSRAVWWHNLRYAR